MLYPNLTLFATTNFLSVLNMSATMARQGGQVQLEPSGIHLSLDMAKMPTGWFSLTPIEEAQQLIKTPCTQLHVDIECGVVFSGHNKVKATIKNHLAMVCE
jgi:hypothetical protein